MIEELLRYQEADASLRKIEVLLSKSEDRQKVVTAKKFLEGMNDATNKLDLKATELVAAYQKAVDDLNKLKEQESEFSKAAETVKEANEIEYLIKKTDELLSQIKNISALVSKINDEIQGTLKEYSAIRQTGKVMKAQYDESYPKYVELRNSVTKEKETAEKELEKLKKSVDATLMEKYLAKRANKMYPVVYEVNGEVCGACNMQLSMNELNRLKNGEIIECDQCGRMLYMKQ